jgi:hypothetical protein
MDTKLKIKRYRYLHKFLNSILGLLIKIDKKKRITLIKISIYFIFNGIKIFN